MQKKKIEPSKKLFFLFLFISVSFASVAALCVNLFIENQGLKELLRVTKLSLEKEMAKKVETPVANAETEREEENASVADEVEPHPTSTPVVRATKRAKISAVPKDAVIISRSWVESLLTTEFSQVLNDASAEPQLENGKFRGFLVSNIRSGSVYNRVGLKENDLIVALNGVRLRDPAQAIQTLNSLRNSNRVTLRVLRGGKLKTLFIVINED